MWILSHEVIFRCESGLKRGLTDVCYGFFSTLANPTRLGILEKLRNRPMNVTDLAEALGQEQSMVSHNLRTLERCNLISSERRGKEKVYAVNKETVGGIFKVVENHAEKHCPFHGACSESQ
jgi:DNA-binding transcriptional ArsR family regulator